MTATPTEPGPKLKTGYLLCRVIFKSENSLTLNTNSKVILLMFIGILPYAVYTGRVEDYFIGILIVSDFLIATSAVLDFMFVFKKIAVINKLLYLEIFLLALLSVASFFAENGETLVKRFALSALFAIGLFFFQLKSLRR